MFTWNMIYEWKGERYDDTLPQQKKRTIRDLSRRAEPVVRTFVQAIHAKHKWSTRSFHTLSHETARVVCHSWHRY